MSTRMRTVIFAVALGLIATLGVASYINSLRAEIVESGAKYPIFVAKTAVPAGTPADDLVSKDLVEAVEIPQQYAAQDAVGVLKDYEGRVLAVPLGVGEQLTAAKFRSEENSELSQRLPVGKIALAVPVDEVIGVGGDIQAGDKIVVIATFEPGPGGSDISRVLLKNIEVLAASSDESSGAAAARGGTKKTITVAVTPSEAEKLVFAEEKGKVWMGLAGSTDETLPATNGQTIEGIF